MTKQEETDRIISESTRILEVIRRTLADYEDRALPEHLEIAYGIVTALRDAGFRIVLQQKGKEIPR